MLHRYCRTTFCITVIAFAVIAVSCGSEGESLYPVSGKVQVAGKPAKGAIIMFIPETADMKLDPPTATAGEDGAFTLVTGDKAGVRAGKYIVTVVWPDPNKKITDAQKMMGAVPQDAPDVLGGRYATREKTTLRVEVKAGPNNLDPFDLK